MAGIDASLVPTTALTVVTWVGAITAIFAASIAVAQDDIKRILAYSTVSQLGYMMMGLGVGGVAVGMFHLITHAFFKALLFMGAGSVIHGCHEEQDIRRMGGLRKLMPVTFATYAVGMLALCGFPLFFSGFWSKDAILHAALDMECFASALLSGHHWRASDGLLHDAPGLLRLLWQITRESGDRRHEPHAATAAHRNDSHDESPAVMTIPLVILAAFSHVAWIALARQRGHGSHRFSKGSKRNLILEDSPRMVSCRSCFRQRSFSFSALASAGGFMGASQSKVLKPRIALERLQPQIFNVLRNGFFVDKLYEATIIRFNAWCARACDWLDRWVWGGAVGS